MRRAETGDPAEVSTTTALEVRGIDRELLPDTLSSYASRPLRMHKHPGIVAGLLFCTVVAAFTCLQAAPPATAYGWIEPGRSEPLPAELQFDDSVGRLGIVNASGSVETKGHPFFSPLGANGRACVTCHQPANAMSLSVAAIRERWKETRGKDPLFAAIDGSNCPDLPQDKESSHSLLLNRGLIRVAIPWPQPNRTPEFSIEVINDPTGCNTSNTYGLHSAHPMISVFRRPRMAANLKYVTNPHPQFALKLGGLADVDPETGQPVSMNFMADAREPSLRSQARTAAREHLQRTSGLSDAMLQRIVDFESQIYVAQIFDLQAGPLDETGGPPALGPRVGPLIRSRLRLLPPTPTLPRRLRVPVCPMSRKGTRLPGVRACVSAIARSPRTPHNKHSVCDFRRENPDSQSGMPDGAGQRLPESAAARAFARSRVRGWVPD